MAHCVSATAVAMATGTGAVCPARLGFSTCSINLESMSRVTRKNTVISCLVFAAAGRTGETGVLTAWDPQERLMWDNLGRPLDAFSLRAKHVFHLVPVAAVSSMLSKRNRVVGLQLRSEATFVPRAPLDVVSLLPSNGCPAKSTEQLLDSFGVDLREIMHRPSCLWVPFEILHLTQCEQWRAIMIRASWSGAGAVEDGLEWPPRSVMRSLRSHRGMSGAACQQIGGKEFERMAND